MTRIKITAWAGLVILSALWLLADPILNIPAEFRPVRAALLNYTGIIGIAAMSIALVLATRPVLAETWFGGLDKMYRLHKWLGVAGLVFAILHWIAANAPHWLVNLGLMEQHARGPRPEITNPIAQFLREQRGLAESLGEWAFYAAVVLIVLALIKRIPYRFFYKTHIWLAVVYLVLVFHSVVLMRFSYWGEAIGPVVGVLLAAGTVSAILLLVKSAGLSRPVMGVVREVEHHAPNRVLEIDVKLDGRWPGHDAGQFAFLTFDDAEGAHPFTIASAWQNDGLLTFFIKELGDYTSSLPDTLKAGQPVKIEGPFGRFDFNTGKPRQVWIAGGIGITPFIARMQRLAEPAPTGQEPHTPVDLFFSTAAENLADFLPRLQKQADAAGVTLHVLQSPQKGFLRAKNIMAAVPNWKDADFWFCGPQGFGKNLHDDLVAAGLSPREFHQEFFQMR